MAKDYKILSIDEFEDLNAYCFSTVVVSTGQLVRKVCS